MSTNVLQVPEQNSDRSLKLEKAKLDRGFYNLIDGERSSAGGRLPVIDPSTGETLATVPNIDREGLEKAVSAAQKAFPAWRKIPFNDRRAMLSGVLNVIEQHIDELSSLLTAEQGRPLAGAKWEIDWATNIYGDAFRRMELPEEESDVEGVGHVVKRYVPLGVVCAISPWNLPVLLSFVKVLPALLTGNTVVLKPSPFTPLTILRIADYVRELLPPGVLNVITGADSLGPWMTSHPGFNKIAFTGSTQTGKRILESAASTLKHVTLELGGNDAGIVLPDADPRRLPRLFFGACSWSMDRVA
jgi:acyl-CoA reductase-like NAD-dependent aldehyde dehydrogenase